MNGITSVERISLAGFFWVYWVFFGKKISTTPNTYDNLQNKTNAATTTPSRLHNLSKNNLFQRTSQNYRTIFSLFSRSQQNKAN